MKHLELGRTANAALAASIMASAVPAPYILGRELPHEAITTANASLFVQAHFSEPLTTYATGWHAPGGLDELCEFLAPTIPGTSERYEHITFPNAEAFLSDVNADDDLRAIGGDFKTVDSTSAKSSRTVPNRGLRMVVDWDKVKNEPNWQETRTAMLMARLKRNAARRKYALAIAAGTDVPLVWDAAGAGDPDLDIVTQAQLSGDVTGITPTHALAGIGAELLRMGCYGGSNTPKGYAGRVLTIEQALKKAGLNARLDETRYQSDTSKSRLTGAKVILFTSAATSTQDPSNFKTAKASTQQGGLYAVYIRQLSVKQWEIVVECYETEFTASTLGVRVLSVTAS